VLVAHTATRAAAAAGRCLKSTTLEAREAAAAVGTMGVATAGCTILIQLTQNWLESAWFQPLKLKCEKLLSKFAFKFDLYRYTTAAHSLPGAAAPARVIPAGEMELGLGIHGEPGAFNAPMVPADQVAAQLLEKITDKSTGYMSCLEGGDGKVAVMVNGLGATPLLELHVAASAARIWLKARGGTCTS
jgi:dihydroxyacetone kinase